MNTCSKARGRSPTATARLSPAAGLVSRPSRLNRTTSRCACFPTTSKSILPRTNPSRSIDIPPRVAAQCASVADADRGYHAGRHRGSPDRLGQQGKAMTLNTEKGTGSAARVVAVDHAGFVVSDLQAAVRFFVDELGFEATERRGE